MLFNTEKNKMILRKISLDNKSDLEFVEKLYIESFPANERRSVMKMHNLIDNNDKFDVFTLIDDENTNSRIGFISLWTFETFIYIEHFAISPEQRSGGYGAKSMNTLIDSVELPLLAEIELPSSSDFALRRLGFYEKLGFKAWDIPYEQPPYEEGYSAIPMLLLTYGRLDLDSQGELVINQIYKEVYNKELCK